MKAAQAGKLNASGHAITPQQIGRSPATSFRREGDWRQMPSALSAAMSRVVRLELPA